MTQDEIRSQREKCADCGGALQEIKVRHFGASNVAVPLFYYTQEVKENSFFGFNLNTSGTLLAFMCSSCARIYFYGAAKDAKSNVKKKPADDDK